MKHENKIKNSKSNYYTISDFAIITGLTRQGIYYKIKNEFEKNKDYKILSNNQPVILINTYTKKFIKPEHKKNLSQFLNKP